MSMVTGRSRDFLLLALSQSGSCPLVLICTTLSDSQLQHTTPSTPHRASLVRYQLPVPGRLLRPTATRDIAKVEHLWDLFPQAGFIGDHFDRDEPGRRPFLQPAWDGGTVDQGGQRSHPLDRLLCRRFRANEVRLFLRVIAYNFGNHLSRLLLPLAVQSWSPTSLQQRLFKTGGCLRHARYFVLQLAESYLTQRLFGQILSRIERPAWHPTRSTAPPNPESME